MVATPCDFPYNMHCKHVGTMANDETTWMFTHGKWHGAQLHKGPFSYLIISIFLQQNPIR
jgi:hypothetical protein